MRCVWFVLRVAQDEAELMLSCVCVCSVPELEDEGEDEVFGGEFTVASSADKRRKTQFFLQAMN